jgi:drug/metabolite transporter (DMT)-like permease
VTHRTATFIGLTAILMWSLLAVLTVATGTIPAFQLAAMTFAIGALIGALTWIGRGDAVRTLRQRPVVWLVGVGGLFGYHALYFLALRFAPPAEAGLLNYLWPLLIVLFSALLPGEKLKAHHIAGVALGFLGAAFLVTRSGSLGGGSMIGYGAAFAAALVWSIYSVASRRFERVPTATVAGFCLVTSGLSAACHFLFETTIWPATAGQWLAVAGLGLFPVGAAFFVWDHGVKHGDIQLLGAAAYGTPLIATLLLILFGHGTFSGTTALACLGITGGALIAAKDMLLRPRRSPTGLPDSAQPTRSADRGRK